MTNKKKYYRLDEIGFVGKQNKKSSEQQKRDAILTEQIIKAEWLVKLFLCLRP